MQGLTFDRFRAADICDGGVSHSRALIAAFAGAFGMALVYGALGRVFAEPAYGAFLVGLTGGALAHRFGGGRSILAGIASACFALGAILAGKAVIGAPPGQVWAVYHTGLADLVFCYLLNPLAALFAAATDGPRDLGRYLGAGE